MSDTRELEKDHERIWLQNKKDASVYEGRLWCEDKVWPDDPEDHEPTEYVRADLYAAERAAREKAEREREEALAEIERMTPRFVAYDYLESPAGREMAEADAARLREALERAVTETARKCAEIAHNWAMTAAKTKDWPGEIMADDIAAAIREAFNLEQGK